MDSSELPQSLESLSDLTEEQRLELIGEDLHSKTDQFARCDPWELAEFLGIYFGDGRYLVGQWQECYKTEASEIQAEFSGYAFHLEGHVSDERLKLLTDPKRGEPPTEEELARVTNAINDMMLNDGAAGWHVHLYRRSDPKGREIIFQCCIGDGGEPFDPIGPYTLRDSPVGETEDDRFLRSEPW